MIASALEAKLHLRRWGKPVRSMQDCILDGAPCTLASVGQFTAAHQRSNNQPTIRNQHRFIQLVASVDPSKTFDKSVSCVRYIMLFCMFEKCGRHTVLVDRVDFIIVDDPPLRHIIKPWPFAIWTL